MSDNKKEEKNDPWSVKFSKDNWEFGKKSIPEFHVPDFHVPDFVKRKEDKK
jgi:hypothetical protein